MPNRRTTFRFDVFEFSLTIILAESVQQTARRLGVNITGAYACFITQGDKPAHGWLIFDTNPSPGTIAHEASHAIWRMLTDVGAMDDETFAYHLHHLVGGIHKFMNKA